VKNQSRTIRIIIVMLAAGLALALTPLLGATDISLLTILQGELTESQRAILYAIRLPRVALGFLAGGSLALGGLVFQSLLRNPLATPFTLGISSGASLGSAMYFHLGIVWSVFGLSGATYLAFVGAALATVIVFAISSAVGRRNNVTLLLAGVAVTFFFSSVILFAQYAADFTAVFKMIRWVMGGLSVVGYDEVYTLLPFAILALVVAVWKSPELNIIATGDDLALSRGVDLKVTIRLFYATLTLAIGAAVALVGPIGFVGIMVAHTARLLFGADNRVLAPICFVLGGAFLVLCDTLARTILSPAELPVGIITALLGGPFFLWLLVRSKGGMSTL
jgi:cobalamin transport system permease protein